MSDVVAMPRQWRIRYTGARYHVTSRGNGREKLFYSDEDRERFLSQLDAALAEDNVILYAYCLMSNHYHLLVETPDGNISSFMKRLNTSYGMYFRYKNARPGHCFETRYYAKLAGGDDYLVRLTRYIHLNPVKVSAMEKATSEEKRKKLSEYRWSSYPGYAGLGPEEERINYRWLGLMGRLMRSGNQKGYRKYVERFLGKSDEKLQEAMVASSYAIGDQSFRDRMEDGLDGARLRKAGNGDIVWPEGKTVELDAVEHEVAKAFEVKVEDLHFHGHRLKSVKAVAVDLCCRLTGMSQRAIAAHYGYRSESSIGKQRKAFAVLLSGDKGLSGLILKIRRRLLKAKV